MSSLISDFEYTWLRFAGTRPAPEELLLLGGQTLEFDGEKICERTGGHGGPPLQLLTNA